MNIFIRNIYKFFFYSLFSVFLIISCSDDKIVYNNLQEKKVNIIIDSEKQKEFEDSLIKTKILFNSNVSNFSVTTSTTLLSADRYVVIYAFNKYFNTYIAKYYSKTAGTLSPQGPVLSLFTGLYTFYAACINEVNVASPNFIDGIYSSINLNTDYLWWTLNSVSPDYPTTNYTIDFKHCCTQVYLVLNLEQNITLKEFSYINITPSNTDNISWNVYNGKIGPSTSLNKTSVTLPFTESNGTTYYAQLIMPPLQVTESTNMIVTFQVIFENDITPKTFHTTLPVYNNYMQPGYSYKYDMILKMDTILFDNVSIVDWVDINVDKTPIIPTGVN